MAGIQPELWVDRASAAVEFYKAAFGAAVLHYVGEGDDIVAQLAVGDAAFWVAAASADMKRFSPDSIGGATGRTLLIVDDPDRGPRAGSECRRSSNCSGQRGARVAVGPNRRSVRTRVGDRAAARGLATALRRGHADPGRPRSAELERAKTRSGASTGFQANR